MSEIIKRNFSATGNAPLKVEEKKSKEYATVYLQEEGYIWLCQNSKLKIDKLVIQSRNPEYDILAAGDDGEDGGPAQDGAAGAEQGDISLTIGELTESIKVVNRGGNGGNGGNGGKGGDGGDGRTNGKGASGGDGGTGGAGGNGGDGPNLVLKYYYEEPVDVEVEILCSAGGKGGEGGSGGRGGRHGDSDAYAPDGKPGAPGKDGKPGNKGTVEIQKIPKQQKRDIVDV